MHSHISMHVNHSLKIMFNEFSVSKFVFIYFSLMKWMTLLMRLMNPKMKKLAKTKKIVGTMKLKKRKAVQNQIKEPENENRGKSCEFLSKSILWFQFMLIT